jgi:hypothetical protein
VVILDVVALPLPLPGSAPSPSVLAEALSVCVPRRCSFLHRAPRVASIVARKDTVTKYLSTKRFASFTSEDDRCVHALCPCGPAR